MPTLPSVLLRRLRDSRGQTMAEYAILIVWIVLLIIVAVTTIGHGLANALSSTAGRI